MGDDTLRVLHLDHSVEPGGAELALTRLVRAAAWRARIVVPRGGSLGVFRESTDSARVSRSGPPQPPGASNTGVAGSALIGGRILASALALVFRRDFRGADVVHANTTRSAIYGAIACRITGKPLVIHLRDLVDPVVMGRVGHLLYTRVAIPAATHIIANSQASLVSAQPFVSSAATVIPSPIGSVTKSARPVNAHRVRVVGMVARLAPWKGQDLLMRAFAACLAGTAVRLRLVGGTAFGEDAYLAELRRLALELGIADQVDFVGHRDDVASELDLMDICVHYSTRPEPLGQNVLQYLSAGKVVVAAAEGGPAEWIDDGVNARLVAPRNVQALADALRDLVDDPALRARLAHHAATTPGLLTDESIADAHQRVFERAAGRAAPSTALRVLRVAHHAPASAWRERERELRRLGVDVSLISSKRWDVGGTRVTLDAGADTFVRGVATVGTHPSLFVFNPVPVWRALGQHPDLIDLHEEPNALVTAEVLLLRWLRRSHAPYVLYSAQNIDKRYPLPFRLIERLSLRGAAGVYVCNLEAAAIVERKGLRVPATYLPLGVDLETLSADDRTAPSATGVVGYVGRLERHKGVQVLLEAMVGTRWTAVIVGDGTEREALEQLASELGVADRVEFAGHRSGEHLRDTMRSFDVLAVPSLPTKRWREQFGRVAVEAMASGVPVIASDTGALPDVVGGVGVLVAAGDPGALAEAVESTLSPDTWRSLRSAGLHRAPDFSWERVAMGQQELYEQVRNAPSRVVGRELHGVIIAYGDPGDLDGALAAVAGSLPMTVVDNSGLAQTKAVAELHGARYIDAGRNRGFAGGVNLALEHLGADPIIDVALINPDARVTPDVLVTMHRDLLADGRAAAVGVPQTNPHTADSMRVWWPFPSPAGAWLEAVGLGRFDRRRGFAVGSVLILRAEAVRDVGAFDERFFLYAEETDWQRRAVSRGWRILVSDATATHEGGGTSSDPTVREAHFYRSQQLYIRKHFGEAGWTSYRLAHLAGAAVRARVLPGERGAAARRKMAHLRTEAGRSPLDETARSGDPS